MQGAERRAHSDQAGGRLEVPEVDRFAAEAERTAVVLVPVLMVMETVMLRSKIAGLLISHLADCSALEP